MLCNRPTEVCYTWSCRYGEAVVMLLQNTLLLALIYRYTNTGWVRAAGVLGGSVAAVVSVLSGTYNTCLD